MTDTLVGLLAVLFLVYHLWGQMDRKLYISEEYDTFVLKKADRFIPCFRLYQQGGFFFNQLLGIYLEGDHLGVVYRALLAVTRRRNGWLIEVSLDEFTNIGCELKSRFPFVKPYLVRGFEEFHCTGNGVEAGETGTD